MNARGRWLLLGQRACLLLLLLCSLLLFLFLFLFSIFPFRHFVVVIVVVVVNQSATRLNHNQIANIRLRGVFGRTYESSIDFVHEALELRSIRDWQTSRSTKDRRERPTKKGLVDKGPTCRVRCVHCTRWSKQIVAKRAQPVRSALFDQ